jgi:hypothetical protein
MCARHVYQLGGESPLHGKMSKVLAKCKGVHREVESEGSRRQSFGSRNTNYIRRVLWMSLHNKTKSEDIKAIIHVNVASI